MFIFWGIVALVVLMIFVDVIFSVMHEWEYISPTLRKCKICGRVEYSSDHPDDIGRWWEVFEIGDETAHMKHQEEIK